MTRTWQLSTTRLHFRSGEADGRRTTASGAEYRNRVVSALLSSAPSDSVGPAVGRLHGEEHGSPRAPLLSLSRAAGQASYLLFRMADRMCVVLARLLAHLPNRAQPAAVERVRVGRASAIDEPPGATCDRPQDGCRGAACHLAGRCVDAVLLASEPVGPAAGCVMRWLRQRHRRRSYVRADADRQATEAGTECDATHRTVIAERVRSVGVRWTALLLVALSSNGLPFPGRPS
jgi:hypothetical protein